MKRLIVLTGENCGYCKKAKMQIKRALEKEPKYTALDISFVIEDSAEDHGFSHTLVPAFFAGESLLYEGNPAMDIITRILEDCYNSTS